MKYKNVQKKYNTKISKFIDCDMMDCPNISNLISTFVLQKLKVYQYSIKHWNNTANKYLNFTLLANNPKECHILFRNFIREKYNVCPGKIYVRYYNELSDKIYTGNSRVLNVTVHSNSLLRPKIEYVYNYNKPTKTLKLIRKEISMSDKYSRSHNERTITADDLINLYK